MCDFINMKMKYTLEYNLKQRYLPLFTGRSKVTIRALQHNEGLNSGAFLDV